MFVKRGLARKKTAEINFCRKKLFHFEAESSTAAENEAFSEKNILASDLIFLPNNLFDAGFTQHMA